jgi:hypothetical protein
MTKPVNDCPPETHVLLKTLTREFIQAERSVALRCRREASRLGGVAPARVLLAVSTHAEQVSAGLPEFARRHGLPDAALGGALLALFSQAREQLSELLVDSERAYRETLLACRQGIDLVRLMRHATSETCDIALSEFLDEWLATRIVLVESVEEELAWFAKNPLEAQKNMRTHTALRAVISRSARV